VGLVTGNIERGARLKLEPFGLNPFFAGGGFGSDDPDRCAIARAAHRAMSRIAGVDFAPHRVVVVGDTEHDVTCAQSNGFRALAVDSGWGDRAAIARLAPDAHLPTLSDTVEVLRILGLS
jgi:phosphoglycolate phosphatase-like HAD superfamily hydrolase